jgi:hypothetical protein
LWGELVGALKLLGETVYPRTQAESAAGINEYAQGNSVGHIVNPYARPGDVRRYGAVSGDDPTATYSGNTAAIQAALNSNRRVFGFKPGEVYMTHTLWPLSSQVIDLNGATLKLLAESKYHSPVIMCSPAARVVADLWYRDGITTMKDVTIRNGFIDGNVSKNLTPVQEKGVPGAVSNDGGMDGVRIANDAHRIKLENLRISNCFTDGVNISHSGKGVSGAPLDIVMVDVDCDGNGRQGMSITKGNKMSFTHCKFRNTYNEMLPRGPWAGVDIEPYSSVDDVTFTDCDFSGNSGVGFKGYILRASEGSNWLFENCHSWGNASFDIEFAAGKSSSYRNILINNSVFDKALAIQGYGKSRVDLKFSNCTIGNPTFNRSAVIVRTIGAGSRIQFIDCSMLSARTDKWAAPLDLADVDGTDLLVVGGVIKNYSPSPAICVLTKANVVDCTIRFSGALIEGGGTGITCKGASDYYIAGGTIVSGCTDYGIRASSSRYSARPNVYLGDSIIRDCGIGVYAHGAGDPNVQVNGSQFIDCTTDTVGVTRSSQ